jgi:exopolysaccharide production protein ExoZ
MIMHESRFLFPHGHTFATIQALRLVAALMVVVTHATFYISTRMGNDMQIWDTGAQGVHIFFVISGFVMTWTAAPLTGGPSSARYFFVSRIIRIVPLYWALNLAKALQVHLAPGVAFAKPDVGNILLSMLFIPSRNQEGMIEAFYGVGWTLNFEMLFYAVFGLAILLRVRTLYFVAVVMIAFAAGSLLRDPSWPAVSYFLHPIVLNFVWGMVIAELDLRGIRVPPAICVLCLIVGFSVIFSYPAPTMEMFGAQYALVVAGLVFLESRVGTLIPRWAVQGGNASYSLYLLHPMVGVVTAMLLSKLGVHSSAAGFAAIVGGSLISASVCFMLFEKPITKALRACFSVVRDTKDAAPVNARTVT